MTFLRSGQHLIINSKIWCMRALNRRWGERGWLRTIKLCFTLKVSHTSLRSRLPLWVPPINTIWNTAVIGSVEMADYQASKIWTSITKRCSKVIRKAQPISQLLRQTWPIYARLSQARMVRFSAPLANTPHAQLPHPGKRMLRIRRSRFRQTLSIWTWSRSRHVVKQMNCRWSKSPQPWSTLSTLCLRFSHTRAYDRHQEELHWS